MPRIDPKAIHRPLYQPPRGRFVEVDVPELCFVRVDGEGDPNTAPAYRAAVEWLYGVSYAMKFAARDLLGQDFGVAPLEALWWADDPAAFVHREKDQWRWTVQILSPAGLPPELFGPATQKTADRRGDPPASLRLERCAEGRALQTLHVGAYDAEGPTLRRLHEELMPEMRLTFNGPHHEIYLNDPRRTAAERLRTILRQPVRARAGAPAGPADGPLSPPAAPRGPGPR
jgi:hypothetical protein